MSRKEDLSRRIQNAERFMDRAWHDSMLTNAGTAKFSKIASLVAHARKEWAQGMFDVTQRDLEEAEKLIKEGE